MKLKKENIFRNLQVQTRKKEKIKKEKVNKKWIAQIAFISFFISIFMSFFSEITLKNVNLIISIMITLFFIFLGVIFDIVGVSVTSSDEKVFHSMNSRRVKGANVAVKFKKNADKVSSFCCDVIGDICGVISGAAGVVITAILIRETGMNELFITLITTAVIASLTITGKAIGKSFAINKSNIILYEFSKLVSYFYKG